MVNSKSSGTKPRTKLNYYLWAILVPLILLAIIFGVLQIAPFGGKSLLISDLATQYLPFFAYLREQLLQHSISSYSFLVSIGDGMLPIYTYYLMSPFNLIIVFFAKAQLPLAINLIISLKIILSSVSMSWFLQRKYQSTSLVGVAGGIAYGFCSFVAMYFYDLMWLDALITLPIVIYGLEQLVQRQKSWLYTFALALTIIVNYYMGYIICVFAVIYFVYLLMKQRPQDTRWSKYVSVIRPTIFRFIWFSLMAGLLSGFMLLPTVLAMLSTGKGVFSWWSFMPLPAFGPSSLVNLGVGASNFDGRLLHGPSIFSGSFFLIGAVVYFRSAQITKQNKRAAGWLLLAVLLGMGIETFNTIWHMLQQPAGFPFRMVYLFSFAVIMLTYEGYLKGMFAEKQTVIKTAVLIMVLILIGYAVANFTANQQDLNQLLTYQYLVSNWNIIFAAAFLLTTVLVIGTGKNHYQLAQYLILLLVSVEMGFNFWEANKAMPLVQTKQYSQAFKRSEKQFSKLKDKQFYRSNVYNLDLRKSFPVDYNGYNDSLIFGYRGINSYSSTLNSNTWHVLNSLGFDSRNVRRIGSMGATPITRQLLGLKYDVVVDGKHSEIIVDHQTSGLGFMTNRQIKDVHFSANQPFYNLNMLINAETGRSENPFVLAQDIKIRQTTYHDRFQYHLIVKAQLDGQQYLYVPQVRLAETEVKINNQVVDPRLRGLGTQVIKINRAKKGQLTDIKIDSKQPIYELSQMVASFDQPRFNKVYQELNRHSLNVKNAERLTNNGSHFAGTITVDKDKPILLVSLPYNDGWQIKSDGKQVPTVKVADGLLGVELTPGQHRLQFNYQVEGLKAGILVSIMSALMMLGTVVWQRFKK
ncbi:YfhO family protein [Lentilactobacillus senioris]|uniref:YfhO family protein n=1 Tax=Lentilactobacillus senioris TaxID=931534 RepID=UPI00227F1FE9|nr:YfhO family protein [Lentilactobacillus senioris]MCY9806397.1 YfhO family protein [Lentilactobacillus senioris]